MRHCHLWSKIDQTPDHTVPVKVEAIEGVVAIEGQEGEGLVIVEGGGEGEGLVIEEVVVEVIKV